MVGIASGILYLAAPSAAPVLSAVAGPEAMRVAGPAAARDVPIVITYLPTVRRRANASLDEVVAEEVRRVADARPGSVDPAVTTDDATTVADAVIAEHEGRIAFLRQRLAIARADRTYASLIDNLGVRLRHAEAARQIALARRAITSPASPDLRAAVVAVARRAAPSRAPEAPTAAARRRVGARLAATAPRVGAPLASHLVVPLTHDVPRRPAALAAAGADPTGGRLAGVGTRPVHGAGPGSLAVAIGPASRLTRPRVMDPAVAARLAESRRLLATARALLEPEVARSRPIAGRTFEIAGLWKWQGSESWSLSDLPSRV